MATEVREHEERGHSARYLILIFLVCTATCGVFFSLGFLVGYNERVSHAVPSTEVVAPPPIIPPTVNPPPDSTPPTPQQSAAAQATPDAAPETVALPPGEGGGNTPPPAAKPEQAALPGKQPQTAPKPAVNLPAPPAPAAGNVGEGITLQVVALRTQQDADHLVGILKEKGYPVFLVTPEYARADDNLYRVQVGPFRTRADADQVRDKLVKEGFKPFIKH